MTGASSEPCVARNLSSRSRPPPPLPHRSGPGVGVGWGGWRVLRASDCTVGVAGSRAVRRASSGLHPPPAELQAVGVRQGRAAREAEPLLLSRPALSHVHRQPRRPRRVAPHFGAALGVAGLELLRDGSRAVS